MNRSIQRLRRRDATGRSTPLCGLIALAAPLFFLALLAAPGRAQCIELRSGAGQGIRFVAQSSPATPLSNQSFLPADYAAACGGNAAVAVAPFDSSWLFPLPADNTCQWLAVDASHTPRSTLFCQSFELPACNVVTASLQFWFAATDRLGDGSSGPNPLGVALNGTPVAGFSGGSSNAQTYLFHNDVSSLLVPGTNHLQVYLRDTDGTASGLIYRARICYQSCQPLEVITLRTGNGPIFTPDPGIHFYAGSPATPIKATAITPGSDPLFFQASNGPQIPITSSALTWCTQLSSDPSAQWVAADQQLSGRSLLLSQTFPVKSCQVQKATLLFQCNVDDAVGDLGAPGNVGLYLNNQPIAGSILNGSDGAGCDLTFSADVTGMVWPNAANTLHVYVSDDDGVRTGIVYSAKLSIVPCATAETIVLRSDPNQNIRYVAASTAQTPLSNSPFNVVDFQNSVFGPQAVASNIHPSWTPTLPCDAQAQWMGLPGGIPRSALYAHLFTVTTCQNNIKRVKLEICFCGDDVLGDSTFGGPNASGLYINGHPIPMGNVTGNYGSQTNFTAYLPPAWVLHGGNVLYLYNRDLGGQVSGVLYSARISILPCSSSVIYGDACGNPGPTMTLATRAEIGRPLEVELRAAAVATPALAFIGLSDSLWNGLALPFDLSVLGAPGCRVLASMDIALPFVFTSALGEASYSLPIPNDTGLVDQTLFFQSIVVDPTGTNALGLHLSAGHAVTIDLPGS